MYNIIRIIIVALVYWLIAFPILLDNLDKTYLSPLIPLLHLLITLPLLPEMILSIILLIIKKKLNLDYIFIFIQAIFLLGAYIFYAFNKSTIHNVVFSHFLVSFLVMMFINIALIFSFRQISNYLIK